MYTLDYSIISACVHIHTHTLTCTCGRTLHAKAYRLYTSKDAIKVNLYTYMYANTCQEYYIINTRLIIISLKFINWDVIYSESVCKYY